jgi:hypothetical protein
MKGDKYKIFWACLSLMVCLWSGIAMGQDTSPHMSFSNSLVEVTFALDDKPAQRQEDMFHTVMFYYITKDRIGMIRSEHHWANHGGGSKDPKAQEKAVQCTKLLKSLDQPKGLPESSNHILTVRYLDAGKTIERKFPINQVPTEVRETLILEGCPKNGEELKRLKFIQKLNERPR